jgi:hypothetical protein
MSMNNQSVVRDNYAHLKNRPKNRADIGNLFQTPEVGETVSPTPGTNGTRDASIVDTVPTTVEVIGDDLENDSRREARNHVDDVSDPDSPEYNPSDPDFETDWSENNSAREYSPANHSISDQEAAKRNDSTGTGGISGVPLVNAGVVPARSMGGPGVAVSEIHSARQVADGLLRGKK